MQLAARRCRWIPRSMRSHEKISGCGAGGPHHGLQSLRRNMSALDALCPSRGSKQHSWKPVTCNGIRYPVRLQNRVSVCAEQRHVAQIALWTVVQIAPFRTRQCDRPFAQTTLSFLANRSKVQVQSRQGDLVRIALFLEGETCGVIGLHGNGGALVRQYGTACQPERHGWRVDG